MPQLGVSGGGGGGAKRSVLRDSAIVVLTEFGVCVVEEQTLRGGVVARRVAEAREKSIRRRSHLTKSMLQGFGFLCISILLLFLFFFFFYCKASAFDLFRCLSEFSPFSMYTSLENTRIRIRIRRSFISNPKYILSKKKLKKIMIKHFHIMFTNNV